MYSEWLESLPKKSNSFENFLLKGLKLPLANFYDPLASVIGNYFVDNENFVVFTSNSPDDAIKEVITENTAIVTNKWQFNNLLNSFGPFVYSEDDFSSLDISSFRHLIFYNCNLRTDLKDIHISAFYDYSGLFNPSQFKEFINEKLKFIPEDFLFTTICKYPNERNVEFCFGTSDALKHISIPSNCTIFHKNDLNQKIKNQLESNGNILISAIPSFIRCDKFIFYDISIDSLLSVLAQVENVVIVYTKDDFSILPEVVKVLQSVGLDVSDSILKIVSSCN